ncbi:MAG: class I SAM-dependent methyltransferase [bacterium]
MSLKDTMDGIYREWELDAIPWNTETPPAVLVELVESGWVQPCAAVDLGCGAGNYAVWLAGRGFAVTGLDLSPAAVELARRLAERKGAACRFEARDLIADVEGLEGLEGSFDLAYDWEVLHHVFPEDRDVYMSNVHRLLRAGAKYLSVCFSEQDSFAGTGKFRQTPLGTTLYFSSEAELTALFEQWFTVEELCTIEVPGTVGPHKAVKALLSKRGF